MGLTEAFLKGEEERLIALEAEADSIAGVHRAHCDDYAERSYNEGGCEFDRLMAQVDALLAKAIRLEQSRADKAEPIPVFSPAVPA